MTRGERERLIQRYLSGEMSSTEESDFFIQVALDKELRQDLKAQRTIESAFRKDRESEPSEHTALRSRVAMVLAASTASMNTPGQAPAADNGTKIPEGAPAAGRLGRLVARPGRWIITSTAALVLTVGILFMLPGEEPATSTTPSPGLVEPGASKSSPPSSTNDPARGPMSPSAPAPNLSPGMRNDGAAPKENNNAMNNPPASVSSDGVSLGSAAQAPRRTSQSFDGSSSRADRPRGSESTTLRRSTRTRSGAASSSASASTNTIDNSSTHSSDGGAVDPSRSRKLGSDSIDAGVTVRLKRPMRK